MTHAPQDKRAAWLGFIGMKLCAADLHCTACCLDSADSVSIGTVQQSNSIDTTGELHQCLGRRFQNTSYIPPMSAFELTENGEQLPYLNFFAFER